MSHASLKCGSAPGKCMECPCQAGSGESPPTPCGHPGWQQRPCVFLCVVSFHSMSQKAPVTGHVTPYSPAKKLWQRISGKPSKDREGSCGQKGACAERAGYNLVRLASGKGLWPHKTKGYLGGSSCWVNSTNSSSLW